ncbi:MAG: flagellin [Bryobacteraceae bacterium]|jgi:flagellin
MSLSIQTNTDSLIAQENLLTNSIFQSNTIDQLTSGYRINEAGDDPAGLAVANQYASAISELTQGYANGNDATAQLQIMDGGMSNISQIVNTLQTLATQSASGSFTGDRTTLNNEFQTDLGEINRQAQSIGLNTGGTFAKLMSVYFGAGSGSQSTANGIVNVDLSHATVDTQSLGLSGVQAVSLNPLGAASDYDLGASSATSVNAIATTGANVAALINGDTSFTFTGPGFGGANGVKINVNMNGVDDTTSLVQAINAAIQSAATTAGASNGAFAAAGITASIHTDADGKEQLAFSSSNAAFQVAADDLMSNALMGNLAAPGAPTGAAAGSAGSSLIAGGSYMLGTQGSPNTETDLLYSQVSAGAATQAVTISANDASGTAHTLTVKLTNADTDTIADTLGAINSALQNSDDSTLQQITAVQNPAGTALNFISTLPNFQVSLGTTSDGTGLTTQTPAQGMTLTAMQVGTGGTADIGTMAGAQAAVTAITNAVSLLGTAQAAVGTGEDQLGFASSLAQSQITNFSSAESQIRDANVAEQAANLSKAQVLEQSTIAAMAQANAEPQALLTLLKGT